MEPLLLFNNPTSSSDLLCFKFFFTTIDPERKPVSVLRCCGCGRAGWNGGGCCFRIYVQDFEGPERQNIARDQAFHWGSAGTRAPPLQAASNNQQIKKKNKCDFYVYLFCCICQREFTLSENYEENHTPDRPEQGWCIYISQQCGATLLSCQQSFVIIFPRHSFCCKAYVVKHPNDQSDCRSRQT